jgi:flagellar hook-length control protein FliK
MNISENILNVKPSVVALDRKAAPADRFSDVLKKMRQLSDRSDPGCNADENQTAKQVVQGATQDIGHRPQTSLDVSRSTESPASVSPPQDIDRLTGEMVDEIQTFQSADGSRSIELSFNSRTLDGLQVTIQALGGELGIRFATQSEQVARLLSQHSDQLQQALEHRGLRVGGIKINPTQPLRPGGRDGDR